MERHDTARAPAVDGHLRRRRGVFVDLAIAMAALGLGVGLVFPMAVVALGVPRTIALRPGFFAATLTAGLLVGLANNAVARRVVGSHLGTLTGRMERVRDVIREATFTDDWTGFDPVGAMLSIESNDEIGDLAGSFNELLEALHSAKTVESSLSGFTSTISQHLALDVLAEVMLRGMIECAGGRSGALFIDDDDGTMTAQASWRLEPQAIDSPSLHARAGAGDVCLLPGVRAAAGDRTGAHQLVAVPLIRADATLGAVVIGFDQPLTPHIYHVLDVLRGTAGVALHNALTHRQLHTLATVDSLTGVSNRRAGLARLEEEWRAAIRTGGALGLLTLDLDHFKRVNDTYGHQAGDEVLRRAAQAIRTVVRDRDLIVRTGGEEFVVVLPGAGTDAIRRVGERLRAQIAATAAYTDAGPIAVTTSVGGASHPEQPCASAMDLLQIADAALYRAKREGRDRLALASAG